MRFRKVSRKGALIELPVLLHREYLVSLVSDER
jgi:hypothetical protein